MSASSLAMKPLNFVNGLEGMKKAQRSSSGLLVPGQPEMIEADRIRKLLESARNGKLDELKIAHIAGPPIEGFLNKPDSRGKTALMYASAFGNKDIVNYLLAHSKEIKVDARDKTDKTALHHAARRAEKRRVPEFELDQISIVTQLLNYRADMEAKDHTGGTALIFAAKNDDCSLWKKLIEERADITVKDHRPSDALGYATSLGSKKIQELIQPNSGVASEGDPAAGEKPSGQQLQQQQQQKKEKKPKPKAKGKLGDDSKEGDKDASRRATTANEAISALQAAMASAEKDLKGLEDAIAQAEKSEVAESELKKARGIFNLATAEQSGKIPKLKAAVDEGPEAGLVEKDLGKFKKLLEEWKADIEKKLTDAISSRDTKILKEAIGNAKKKDAETAKLKEAEQVLAQEEAMEKIRKELRAAEASAKSATEAVAGSKKEAAAMQTKSRSDLKTALAKCLEIGLPETDPAFVEAKKALGVIMAMGELDEARKAGLAICKQEEIGPIQTAKKKLFTVIAQAKEAGVPAEIWQLAEKDRKKLHNRIEDIKGAIRVFCRVRPFNKREEEMGDTDIITIKDSISLEVGSGSKKDKFSFDAVYHPGEQDELFEDCRDLVQSAVDGYNVTIFAYGQTGAGKTFTMSGVPGKIGMSPRIISELYEIVDREKSYDIKVTGSMLELHKADLNDLLIPADAKKQKLSIKMNGNKVVIEHLTKKDCHTAQELQTLYDDAFKSRTVAATAMNKESSRSHLLFIIEVTSENKETKASQSGKMFIVDLAGSERIKKSETKGDALEESIQINKSLTALGNVIGKLSRKEPAPYREHLLTELMQDSLGGSAKTLMFMNCSPAKSNEEETINALKFARDAKKVTSVGQVKNKGAPGGT